MASCDGVAQPPTPPPAHAPVHAQAASGRTFFFSSSTSLPSSSRELCRQHGVGVSGEWVQPCRRRIAPAAPTAAPPDVPPPPGVAAVQPAHLEQQVAVGEPRGVTQADQFQGLGHLQGSREPDSPRLPDQSPHCRPPATLPAAG
jgi:hypothetical protein